ncbi:diguanylate cyclase [Shewanella insulae]|uniref:sensor domain-containing diguanylate cyclase n=1 Tax=Shewanella insulae TaxID=2681496 RepID=UPI001EFE79E0|nr:sensor domain-containing diguanylate cyclase [Shewanella insulae]MCG9753937.1 diguanylate cyclase [Shewanella insulae]
MLDNISINKKLPAVMIFFAIMSMMVASFVAYINISSSVENLIKQNLLSLLESRKSSLDNYFSTLESEVSFHSQSPLVSDALAKFSSSFQRLPNDREGYLKRKYIVENPFSASQKESFLSSNDGSDYSRHHAFFHPIFLNLIQSNTYYDMFLVDKHGNLVYTVKKDEDYATSLVDGPWKSSPLSKIFTSINEKHSPGDIQYSDVENYPPNDNKPASFIGSPVFSPNNDYLGALIFQLPIEPIDRIMQVTAGMGITGESYLVGSDLLMRSDSRFADSQSILKTKVDTVSSRAGLQGIAGDGVIIDYRGREVYSAYKPISFKGVNWVIIVERDRDEVFYPISVMGKILILSNLVVVIFVIVSGYLLGSSISNPIRTMTNAMLKLARNDLSANISVNKRKDEVGQMAKAMIVFKNNAVEREELKNRLEYLAEHDNLTGLATRGYALNQLELLMETSSSKGNLLVVMFIDLDNFKAVNDTLGHDAGDRLLCEVARSLTNSLRKDDLVARIGGDEFLVILPNVENLNLVESVVQKLMTSVKSSLILDCEIDFVTLSAGLSVYPDDDVNADGLIKKADESMYLAKNNGKDNYRFWSEFLEGNREAQN